jgi:threonine/homoserine/homoserine lactone efflux protein
MGSELGEVFAAATAVAISPVPIVAIILILFSAHARRNGIFYLFGWVLGLVIVLGAVLLLPDGLFVDSSPVLRMGGSVLRLVVGLLLIAAAFAVWLRRPKAGEAHPLPRWAEQIEQFSAVNAMGLAIGLAVINPKNLAVSFSVLLTLAESGAGPWQARLALVLFVLLGSSSIAMPVLYRLVAGKQADHHLQEWKDWLMHNNATVMFVLLLFMGMLILGKGLGALPAFTQVGG